MKHRNKLIKGTVLLLMLTTILTSMLLIPEKLSFGKKSDEIVIVNKVEAQEIDKNKYLVAANLVEKNILIKTYDYSLEELNRFALEEVGEPSAVSQKIVYLTFDDGPKETTGELLDVLAKYNAVATFFMLEPLIREFPEVVLQKVEFGHALASHGVSHQLHKFYASTSSVVSEMKETQKAIKEITGIDTNLIRTPFGSSPHMTPAYKKAVHDQGLIMWDWNVDSRDWFHRGPGYVAETLAQIKRLEARNENPVVLLHDLKTTTDHLEQLLEVLVNDGYEFKILTADLTPIHLP